MSLRILLDFLNGTSTIISPTDSCCWVFGSSGVFGFLARSEGGSDSKPPSRAWTLPTFGPIASRSSLLLPTFGPIASRSSLLLTSISQWSSSSSSESDWSSETGGSSFSLSSGSSSVRSLWVFFVNCLAGLSDSTNLTSRETYIRLFSGHQSRYCVVVISYPTRMQSFEVQSIFVRISFGSCMYAAHPNIRRCLRSGFSLCHAS